MTYAKAAPSSVTPDVVAICADDTDGFGRLIHLTPAEARALAAELVKAADEIEAGHAARWQHGQTMRDAIDRATRSSLDDF